ncbi:MAG: serine protease [Pyrinomonadaceae bacterium]|jgi:subtilisin family serine protease|nr:serine protease [Pyrinomonadaceae bacterium]
MFARPSRKISARARVFFSVLFVLALAIILASGPRSSKATQQAGMPDGSQKRSKPAFVPGEALVRYRSEGAAKRVATQTTLAVNAHQVLIRIERFEGADIVPGLRLAHMAPEQTLDAIEALNKQPDVLYAEPNYLLHPDLTPDDPRFVSNELYGLNKIGAPAAWNTTQGNSSIVVGVIDEGIDKTHEDLASNIWVNPGEIAGNGVDDDGNGFIDDVNGYNFAGNSGTIPAESHATHVAGTIGAVGNNSIGVVGVNWNVRLMSLRFINGSTGNTANAIRAVNYAKLMKDLWESSGHTKGANIRVLNNSYGGGGFDQSFLDAITGANQSGILFVAAAGNIDNASSDNGDNELVPHFPSSYNVPNVIGVAATDSADNLAGFSHYGANTVPLGAPGVGILSTTPGNTYSSFSGTSMASPHVAGAAALLLAANPNLTVQQLRSLLLYNGDLLDPALTGKTFTGRRLNVGNSFVALTEGDVTPPGTVTNFHINSQNGRSFNIGWNASGDNGAAGQASLYTVSFTDGTSGAVTPLKNTIPTASGTTQAIDLKIPYRHTSGTLTLREFDNVGNEGTPATFSVTINPIQGDPYVTQLAGATALSSGGTALGLVGDDKLKLNYTLPFSFPFFGENFTSVNISTNGNLFFSTPPTRSNGDADDVPGSAVGLAQFKMIAGLWDDLRTDGHAGDDVYVVVPDASHIIFRWQGEIFGDGSPAASQPTVNFEIELRSDGTIVTRYGGGNTNLFPVVGIGGGEPDAYVIPSHTSEQSPISLTNAQTVLFQPRLSLSTVEFSQSPFNTAEATGSATVTVTRAGNTSLQASVDYVTIDGSATQKGDYLFASGRLTFAPGETSKSITVLIVDDVYQEGAESFSVALSNPAGMTIGARNVASVTIADNDTVPPTSNPLDNSDARFFVRQHYIDFLNRDPDQGGLDFWSHQISDCGSTQSCIELKRINVSAAFFLSIEFQQTGYLVERMYKVAYGDATGTSTFNGVHTLPVPIVRFNEFLVDSQQIGRGVVIGQPGADQLLENNKVAFAAEFVGRTRFTSAYASTLTPSQFVDALFAHAGVTPSTADRNAAINEFGGAGTTADNAARGRALRRIAENNLLDNAEKNKAFVLMQYFGYLRRDPNSGQDTDHTGYDFWLTKLLEFNGNFVNAEMVKAFIVSAEYRQRFGPG